MGIGKGIATYYDKNKIKYDEEVTTDKFQILKFKHKILDIINIYRSQTGHSVELLENLKNMIEPGRMTIITGDFNICFIENFSNRMIQGLLAMGFDQLIHEPTHIRGRHIDHVYYLDQSNRSKPIIDRYSPYYSDHDGICITLNDLSKQDKEQLVHLVETSLTEEDNEEEYKVDGYEQTFTKVGNGKGIATYYDKEKIKYDEEVTTDKFQILKFRHKILDIINVYRSQTGHSVELLENLKNMIEPGRVTIITGDFNICFIENFNNRMIQGLLTMGFDQLVHEPTHIRGRHIDHVYYLDKSKILKPILDRYSPYYSDHDGICITITDLPEQDEE